jgi:hypothetical protein
MVLHVAVVGDKEVGFLVGLVDAEADDPPGVDADHGSVGSIGAHRLRRSPDLQAADTPRISGRDVVHHKGHLPVGGHVPVLAAARELIAADVDGAEFRVVVEAHRAHLEGPVRLDGGHAADGL